MIRGAALVAVATVTFLLCVLAPLRQTSGDTVPGRYGGVVLHCGGGFDLARIDWIANGIQRRPGSFYYVRRDAAGEVTSVFGPGPAVAGAALLLDVGPGDVIGDGTLRRRERAAAAVLVAISAVLLAIAALARTGLAAACGCALVAASSFAGAATLGQGLWQATVALPFLVAGLAVQAHRARHPRLAVAAPALLGIAALLRPTLGPLAVGLGVWWAVDTGRARRPWLLAAALALAATAPIVVWNCVHLHSPLPLGQLHANARMTDRIFDVSPGHLGYALAGLLVSPGRGVLWHAPIVLVGVISALRSRDRGARAVAITVAAQVLAMSAFFKWYGGSCFGPRLLAEATWISAWLLAMVPWRRIVPAAAITVTVAIGLLALGRWRAEQFETPHQLDVDENAVWNVVDSPIPDLLRDSSAELLALDSPAVSRIVCGTDGAVRTDFVPIR